jgi:vancomycin resistance protein VanJ
MQPRVTERFFSRLSAPSSARSGLIGLLHFATKVALWCYVAGLLAWLLVRAWVGDQWFFVAILSYMGAWLFFPLWIFLPWALLEGWKRSTLALLMPVVLFVWLYGPLLMPKQGARAVSVVPVTILTSNVRYLNTDIEGLSKALIGSGADVLALQEVAPYHKERLAPLLQARYPYGYHQPGVGLAVYSRYPIRSQELLPLEPWPAQSLIIEAGETTFHLVNVHLARAGVLEFAMRFDPAVIQAAVDGREAQIEGILTAIDETGLPTILACDGNMTDLSSGYGEITSRLQDAYREQGWGLGHTLLVPRGLEIPSGVNVAVQRIDYLFHSPDIQALDVRLIRGDSGSDHRPVLGEFELSRGRIDQASK